MIPLKIEIMALPISHAEKGNGMQLAVINNMKEALPQFSPQTQQNLRDLFTILKAVITEYIHDVSSEIHGIECSTETDVGKAIENQFRTPPQESHEE